MSALTYESGWSPLSQKVKLHVDFPLPIKAPSIRLGGCHLGLALSAEKAEQELCTVVFMDSDDDTGPSSMGSSVGGVSMVYKASQVPTSRATFFVLRLGPCLFTYAP